MPPEPSDIINHVADLRQSSLAGRKLCEQLEGEIIDQQMAMRQRDWKGMAAACRRAASMCEQRAEQFRRTAEKALALEAHIQGRAFGEGE